MIKIRSTGYSSIRYGNCEKCGQSCSEVFHVFGFDRRKRYRDMFGCKSCAEAVADDGNQSEGE